ncbi:MAG: ComEA family DNA-binding protein [Eubacterium sp.]|nr:ComEA family DNA-binding protein [Eubacterium sp.]
MSLSAASETEAVSQSVYEPEEPPEPIWVHVCGAVERPGVYELEPGSRVFEAIRAAGGLKEEAEDRSLNQAARLTDGEQITVFTVSEIEEQGGISSASVSTGQERSGGAGTGGSGKVNLNTAGAEELKTLPGIGEVRAAAILLWRETNGPFMMVEDIMQVDGIKEKSFEKIKEYIEV